MRVLRRPDCGSTDIDYEAGLVTGSKYRCQKCAYMGTLVIEEEIPDG